MSCPKAKARHEGPLGAVTPIYETVKSTFSSKFVYIKRLQQISHAERFFYLLCTISWIKICNIIFLVCVQDEYASEHIRWTDIPFFDNQPRLDLLAKPPYGLIHILADATGFPKVSTNPFSYFPFEIFFNQQDAVLSFTRYFSPFSWFSLHVTEPFSQFLLCRLIAIYCIISFDVNVNAPIVSTGR